MSDVPKLILTKNEINKIWLNINFFVCKQPRTPVGKYFVWKN